jgi:hypothetical protein
MLISGIWFNDRWARGVTREQFTDGCMFMRPDLDAASRRAFLSSAYDIINPPPDADAAPPAKRGKRGKRAGGPHN